MNATTRRGRGPHASNDASALFYHLSRAIGRNPGDPSFQFSRYKDVIQPTIDGGSASTSWSLKNHFQRTREGHKTVYSYPTCYFAKSTQPKRPRTLSQSTSRSPSTPFLRQARPSCRKHALLPASTLLHLQHQAPSSWSRVPQFVHTPSPYRSRVRIVPVILPAARR
ncbi:uncharacterized protein SCHCODRAFT_02187588 [Schizophyllum commune H4-8]|uniref:uncharacterized protein n=1 Tax=Schizophyllum commune (strain H4-8 / FGSC 9210) TaxID=578458 RepID=UPI00215F513C|nr:uncharacterized protein SCHCODRAFT_02187588 [Schizophyllum commune H4-8]KAI5896287.1 hypothetical protein SCHCODRAFT_02187588 [Schizophyllum commune H4-8]